MTQPSDTPATSGRFRSPVAAQSSAIGAGSAASFPEFAMTYAPRTRELLRRAKQGACHCVQWRQASDGHEINCSFNSLSINAAAVRCSSGAFRTCICPSTEQPRPENSRSIATAGGFAVGFARLARMSRKALGTVTVTAFDKRPWLRSCRP